MEGKTQRIAQKQSNELIIGMPECNVPEVLIVSTTPTLPDHNLLVLDNDKHIPSVVNDRIS